MGVWDPRTSGKLKPNVHMSGLGPEPLGFRGAKTLHPDRVPRDLRPLVASC